MLDKFESEKLSTVKSIILSKMDELSGSLDTKKADVMFHRQEMWREARVALRDFDDVADLQIFAEALAKAEEKYGNVAIELGKLAKMFDSPYFAKIVFKEDGYSESEEIYIGRHSLFDDESHIFHVYDWRAPISGLYYDFGIGVASFLVPATGVVIKGEISGKRQYRIEKGEVVFLLDSDLAISDEILKFELSKASEASIKTIINTIQAEQNLAIRSESKDLLVMGPAGSGKTSVGLHRLAYLLYRHRDKLTSKIVKIFSPGGFFSSYIEGIIPELGEEDITATDFRSLISEKFDAGFKFYDTLQQVTHLMAEPNELRNIWLQKKYSQDFLDKLEDLIKNYTPTFESVYFINDLIASKERLVSLYTDRTDKGTLQSKTDRVLSFLHDKFKEFYKGNTRKIEEFFEKTFDIDLTANEVQSRFDQEKNIIFEDIKRRLLPSEKKLLEIHMKKMASEYELPFGPAREALYMDKIYFEDALLMLYVKLLTGSLKPDNTVRHVLIDEAQDLSLLHHRIIQLMYPKSAFTVLADVNQALHPEINITNANDLNNLYNKAEIRLLDKSYRSTVEIMTFASKFLTKAGFENNEKCSFLRNGDEPKIITSENTCESIMNIFAEMPNDYKTIGIIVPDKRFAKNLHADLSKLYRGNTLRPLRLILSEAEDFAAGVMIIPVSLAKGLEFDAVICPDYGNEFYETQKGLKILYLICTRALHKLFLLRE